jgi:hypothetical protein
MSSENKALLNVMAERMELEVLRKHGEGVLDRLACQPLPGTWDSDGPAIIRSRRRAASL